MNIIFDEGHPGHGVSQEMLEKMTEAAHFCLAMEGIDEERAEISVTFVSKDEIRALNKEYRDNDSVTDVLSFPQFDDFGDIPEEGEILLGDVVICKERAEEQAEEFGHSFDREAVYLFVHSILHLLGYDHMEDEDKDMMRLQEEKVMAHMGLVREE